ncbi:sarcosine oxidase subunit gamma [Rhizobium sp. RU20A]|uniref:sarcosine oxidase subunit gamma n=1 Tax=Rhizobium sp. RU20A TaxID=1907412 RepID=UPI00095512BF|nr:sarcosine oxidase subunit gamma family protein [Rhizobium sp. RU20A]SIQ33234.1 sarcosine oxidase subunit gamma [Rhizobium sp. RU20A]
MTASTSSPAGTFRKVHPLDAHAAIRLGLPAPDHLAVIRSVAMASVLVAPAFEAEVKAVLSAALGDGLRFVAPGEWLAVSREDMPEGLVARLSVTLAGMADVVDQSDARVLLDLSGPAARTILAKGAGVDLRPDAFPPGASANVLIGHVAANLCACQPDRFEIAVTRSFAVSLLDDLLLMGREFGLSVGFSD